MAGFAPTFFLRPVFTDRPKPACLYVHGAVLTLWFALAFVRGVLVARRRVAGVSVVVMSPGALLQIAGTPFGQAVIERLSP